MRIVLFSERLRLPLDEGFRNVAVHLARALRQQHDVLALTTFGADIAEEGVRNIPSNRLLLSTALRRTIRQFQPDVLLYLPTASVTAAALVRTAVLGWYAPTARRALLALQPRPYGAAIRLTMRLVPPPVIIAQSSQMAQELARLGCRTAIMRAGVDATRFTPVSPLQRAALRHKLGLPVDGYVVLHAGHISASRNVHVLGMLQQAGCRVVLVGSTSTEQDSALAAELERRGVMVVRQYVQHIEEYYQAADCYVFPVQSETGAIALPLSVLEAMSCNLAVVATPYGDLPTLFAEGNGISYARDNSEMVAKVLAARSAIPDTRRLALPFTWEAVAQHIVEVVTSQA